MLRKAIEASLVLSLSLIITMLILRAILPTHIRLSRDPAIDSPAIRPALFIEGVHDRSGAVDAARMCPYLARLAETSRCPALSGRAAGSECPYLSHPDRGTRKRDFPRLARLGDPSAPPISRDGA